MSARVELYRDDRVVKWVRAKGMEPSDMNVHYSARESVQPGKGNWRWRFVKNGRIMADSGQGYSRRIDALNGCAIVLSGRFNQPQWIAEYGGVVTNGVIGYIYRHRAGDELNEWSTFAIPERDAITVHDLTRDEVSR